MIIDRQITAMRKSMDWSQEHLAELIGVSRQAVAKWESGDSVPDIANLLGLARVFNTSVDTLIRGQTCAGSTDTRPDALSLHGRIGPFLLRAKAATYAGNGAERSPSRPASHDHEYAEGDLLYYDSWLGGTEFAGQEAVWEGGRAIWTMNYCGRVTGPGFSGDFLKEALRKVDLSLPYRGPRFFQSGDLSFTCSAAGSFDWFQGREDIYHQGVPCYECVFHGGSLRV